MQDVAAANSQAELLIDELAVQKRAVKQLQKDLQAMKKVHDTQVDRIRTSKFPAAQVSLPGLGASLCFLACAAHQVSVFKVVHLTH